jgi:hypothetical protein
MGIPGDYEDGRVTEAKFVKWIGVCGAKWVMAATDGPLLLGDATKRASEMAVLNSGLVTTRQASIKLAGASNGHIAVSEKPSKGLTANESSANSATPRDWCSCCFFTSVNRCTFLHD